MADELAALVVTGAKRATASAVADYEHAGEPLPRTGQLAIVVDGRGRPRAVIRTVEVRVGPLSSVDDRFAWDEGEGDRSRSGWLRDHESFFRRYLPTIGSRFTDDLPTVFERFEVVFAE
ncbi:MAG: ASCH domain-containing protein [Ilumatobacter sp.]|nr:ASCH domain-containing protein [Ilumatobacter sp.]